MYVLLTIVVIGLVCVAAAGVVGYFNGDSRKHAKEVKSIKAELANANERVSIAQTALIEIASGDAMPVLRASDALSEITKSYTREINS